MGQQRCVSGQWQPCQPQSSQKEICGNRKDDNCDGKVDENCICQEGEERPCGTENPTGECKQGTQTCSNNQWGACVGEGKPTSEICDGNDNDCDGLIDESLTRPCYTGRPNTKNVGICQAGEQTCFNGQWGTCTGEVLPQREICDKKDNDCDGQIDEDLLQKC